MQSDELFDINVAQVQWDCLDFEELSKRVPRDSVETLHAKLQNPLFLGPLGLSLPRHEAIELFRLLVPCTYSVQGGYLMLAAYHKPLVSREQAQPIAMAHLHERIQREFSNLHFYDMRFAREEAMWWIFVVGCEEWKDLIPGVLFASVDKLDGHIWTDDKMLAYWEANSGDYLFPSHEKKWRKK
jgi:hypothetical protein